MRGVRRRGASSCHQLDDVRVSPELALGGGGEGRSTGQCMYMISFHTYTLRCHVGNTCASTYVHVHVDVHSCIHAYTCTCVCIIHVHMHVGTCTATKALHKHTLAHS